MLRSNNKEDGRVSFDPYDDELIKKYLIPKVKGEKCEKCEKFIVTKNVYEKEPWLLDHTNHPIFKENEWYYFVPRTQVSQKNIGCGKKSKRRITGDSDGGNWKANGKKDIMDVDTELVIGQKQTLTYKTSNDNQKKQKTGDGASVIVPGSDSTWTMYEYTLPDKNKFQELVLCKIKKSLEPKKTKKSKTKDDDHPDASVPNSSSEQQPTNIDHQTVLAPSSLEQQQPWLCGGNGPEIPPMGCLCSLTCNGAETERSPQKDGKFEAMEVTQEVDWTEDDLMDLEAFLGINTNDQQQQPTNIDHQSVLAPSSLEQQQPWLCGGNGPEIPPMGCLSSFTCYAGETEGIGEHSGEGSTVHQIDVFSMIETVPERSSEKDGKFGAMEVTQEDDLIEDITNRLEAVLMFNTEDQQQPWLCGGNGQEISPMGCLCSLTCNGAETERSSQKDGKFEAMEVTQEVDWTEDDLMDLEAFLGINTNDQQQQPTNIDHQSALAPSSLEQQQPWLCGGNETVPERSPQKDRKLEAMEVTQEVDWTEDDLIILKAFLGINTNDQQQQQQL